jgi:hypothetical protein
MTGKKVSERLHFDFRDIFLASRLALSGKTIMAQFIGLGVGYLLWLIFTYLAWLLSGLGLSQTWGLYGLFPILDFSFSGTPAWICFIVGNLLFLFCWFISSTAVAQIGFRDLLGDPFYPLTHGYRFAFKSLPTLIFAPGLILFFIVLILLFGVILGLVGKIASVGEVVFSLVYLLPVFPVALALAYIIFNFSISLFFTPAVVATTRSDIFDTIIELFTAVWRQPWRLVVYNGLLYAVAKLVAFVFAYFCFRAGQFVHLSCGLLMGEKLERITATALNYLPRESAIFSYFTNLSPRIRFGFHLPESFHWGSLSGPENVAAFLLGLSFIVIFFFVISYFLATFSVGQLLIYLNLVKRKDDKNLLEEEKAKASTTTPTNEVTSGSFE